MKIYSFEQLNEFISPRNIRQYQWLIVTGQSFGLILQNVIWKFDQCIAKNDRNVLNFEIINFGKITGKLSVISAQCATGYELNIESLYFASCDIPKNTVVRKVICATGHPNFAHFIWNQFPALFNLVSKKNRL
jgi:hypothetical protein